MHLLKYHDRRARGAFLFLDESTGQWEEDAASLKCAHCEFLWQVKPGSGEKRGWCHRCDAPVCGKKLCMTTCVPWEQAMERAESAERLSGAIDRVRAL